MNFEDVPGGYRSGLDALRSLVLAAQLALSVRDALEQSERMAELLRSQLLRLTEERNNALQAINLFAEVAPDSLGIPWRTAPDAPDSETPNADRVLSPIESQVRELLTGELFSGGDSEL